ncbi:uncharacterized protein TM35_000342250 [Trypanosoma theileri]|uniref:J domain-containing protein n=1 Tax=Trypanosoma theileri TaxID=67003 RepID=A0A1X0NM96_9TRYP|nr:uncharacterized protein TM35_000342250 [Trypanosoma theileri]ORC85613.1 hypothetical protein TM35_000342250 [Trypanosoma theileri]
MGCDTEKRNTHNWRLYHLLDLEPPVTAKQVQWTFRKVTLRHHFYQAYLVLCDSDRKSLYDILGEDAVGFIHSGNWGPLILLLGAKGAIACYSASMLLALILMILFFAFLGARVDDVITWSWMRVVAPLFVLAVLTVIVTGVATVVSFCMKAPREEGMQWIERAPAIGNLISAILYTVFAFAIAAKVDDDPTNESRTFVNYFIIIIIADVIYYLSSLVWRWPRRIRLQMKVDLNRPSRFLCYGFFLLAIVYIVLSVIQWVFIGKKIDEKTEMSWYAVFSPFAFRAAFRVLEAFMRSMVLRTIGIKSACGVAFDTLGAFLFNGGLLTSLYFVAVRITRGKDTARMAYALIPVYVTLGYLFLATIFTAIYLARKNTNNAREERLNNLKWTPTEPSPGEGNVPFFLHDQQKDVDWDAIDDDESSSVFPAEDDSEGHDIRDNSDTEDSGDYDDFDSDEEEELFGDIPVEPNPNTSSSQQKQAPYPARRTPYGVTAPPDDDDTAGPYPSSHTPSSESLSTGRPPSQKHHVYHDPYDPKTDAAPATLFTGGSNAVEAESESSSSFPSEEDEEMGDFETDEDDRVGTENSSSASSAYFTPSVSTTRR